MILITDIFIQPPLVNHVHTWVEGQEVAVQQRVHHRMLGGLGEVFLQGVRDDLVFEDLAVFTGHESVLNHFVHFMAPETHEVLGSLELVNVGLHDAFVDFVDVAHVENVVEFDWGTGESLSYLVEGANSHRSHVFGHYFEFFISTPGFVNVPFQYLLVYVHFSLIQTLMHDICVDLSDEPGID